MPRSIPVSWPFKGVSERFGYSKQPPNTARDGGNVVGMEAETDRIRGGQRSGHTKYVSGLVTAGADPVLELGVVIGDDSQLTYSELDDTDIVREGFYATPGGGIAVACAVDLVGRLYCIEGIYDSASVFPTTMAGFYVLSPEGTLLETVTVPVLADTYLRRIAVDDDLNVYVATGVTNPGGGAPAADPLGRVIDQDNSRIFKYRPLVGGEYVLEWTYTPVNTVAGTIDLPVWVSQMVVKGLDLYITTADNAPATPIAELQKFEKINDTIPSTPDVSFAVPYQSLGLAIRDDGYIFTSSVDGAMNATTALETREQYLTKYTPEGTEVWQVLASDPVAAVDDWGGIGFALALDSKDNIYTYGPRRETTGTSVSTDPNNNLVNYWIDLGTSVQHSWAVTGFVLTPAVLALEDVFMQIAVDEFDSVYFTWPIDFTYDFEVAAYDVGGSERFTFPGDSGVHGQRTWVVLPPKTPDYGDDPVKVSEFVYYGGGGVPQGGPTISSSTDADPIVLTVVSSAQILSEDEEILIAGHTVNVNANGRQRIGTKTATTLELLNTKGTGAGAGGADGAIIRLGAVAHLRVVGTAPGSGSTRTQKVLAVAGGAIKIANVSGGTWDDPTLGSTTAAPALDAASEYIAAVTLFRQRFYTDSLSYVVYDLATDEVSAFKATAGTVEPRCKLMTAWNSRLVLARSADDPHGWFMSRAGDAYDWDYFPRSGEVNPTTPAAGVNTDAGRVEDVITGLIPWSDLLLFFMCDHQIWRMTGDPMDNGRIDNVSKTIGMAFGGAWARDPNGVLFFYSAEGGVYRMPPVGLPERISVQWIEKRLRDVDLTSRFAKLAWNYPREGLEIFLTAQDGAGGVQQEHYFWEQLTGAWYPVTFSNVLHEPSSVLVLDGDAPGDRVRLIGCEDGYVRKQDEDARDDDGSAIDSFIILGPYALPQADVTLRMVHGQITLSDSVPGGVNWKLYATDRADSLGTVVKQGHLAPGRSPNLYSMRGRGEWFFLELRNSAAQQSWALESGILSFTTAGRA